MENVIYQTFCGFFLDCGQFTFLTATNNRSNKFETINTYVLNLEQKLSSVAFFDVDKITTISSRKTKLKY